MCLSNQAVGVDKALGAVAASYLERNKAGPPQAAPPAETGSARRRLWDLSPAAPCPVTGVCLRLDDLRRLARRAGLPERGASEYELHVVAVSECRKRTPFAEHVQRELDKRFAACLRTASGHKSELALARWWDGCCLGTDWAGVFWAVLTHPRCTAELEFAVLGQVHMLQHQVGMAARVEHTRLQMLESQNRKLAEELTCTQARLQAVTQEQAERHGQQTRERLEAGAALIRSKTAHAQAVAQLDELHSKAPDLAARQRLAEDNRSLLEHNQQLRRALNQAARRPLLSAQAVGAAPEPPPNTTNAPPVWGADGPSLLDSAVLCVGGRTRVIPIYRELVEGKGARFLHHDGGEEDNAGQLDPMLQSADLVICQVACISHNAYWRVKEHCKRLGKPCFFVETPSRAALQRVLNRWPAASLP